MHQTSKFIKRYATSIPLFLTVVLQAKPMTPINQLPPLFSAYPRLAERINYLPLGNFPTPICALRAISAQLSNVILYCKQDNLCGKQQPSGTTLFGGNKVRKLEFLLADALAQNAKTIITFGCAGSNHVVATAVYSQLLGLQCIGLLKPQPISYGVRRNLALMHHYGAQIRLYATPALREVGAIEILQSNQNPAPYVIHTGGSQPIGVLGFVNAAFELKEQILRGELPEPDYIYVAAGSLGTAAGLLLGCKAAGLKSQIVAVATEPTDHAIITKIIENLFVETAALLHQSDPSFPQFQFLPHDTCIRLSSTGTDYGLFTTEAAKVLQRVMASEQLRLDGTYTAKAFDGLLRDAEAGLLEHKVVLFWHTYDGNNFDHLTKNFDYRALPQALQSYFTQDVQPLDRP